eukprot:gnl/TRDRNA2_/TRDRNA2_176578_c3_seq4.p1 gnl/TRDRNA2_/TRDRNA2_176578_c3~~gnl/TRDRNA2_/TRDRNA2_176578_c3_seq4.p1  ORF type:complete len:357 (+),score=45.38 gnl/TRDRNA2_/TRDRNA2_176578_c3_seq4:380-1450(+)
MHASAKKAAELWTSQAEAFDSTNTVDQVHTGESFEEFFKSLPDIPPLSEEPLPSPFNGKEWYFYGPSIDYQEDAEKDILLSGQQRSGHRISHKFVMPTDGLVYKVKFTNILSCEGADKVDPGATKLDAKYHGKWLLCTEDTPIIVGRMVEGGQYKSTRYNQRPGVLEGKGSVWLKVWDGESIVGAWSDTEPAAAGPGPVLEVLKKPVDGNPGEATETDRHEKAPEHPLAVLQQMEPGEKADEVLKSRFRNLWTTKSSASDGLQLYTADAEHNFSADAIISSKWSYPKEFFVRFFPRERPGGPGQAGAIYKQIAYCVHKEHGTGGRWTLSLNAFRKWVLFSNNHETHDPEVMFESLE